MITQWMFNMKQLNEAIINLDGIYVKSIINFIHLIILVLALKKLVDMSVKIQILEKLFKTHYRDIYIQTEEFKGELISASYYKVREAHYKVFKQPNLFYPVTFKELPND